MKNAKIQPDIDLVYLWVDGSDPVWLAKKNAFAGNAGKDAALINCKGRHADNDELKYSLRSVEKYAPWVRRIFVVTDDQTPRWLDTTNPNIGIIDIKDIMPQKSQPCFNSSVIEACLHNIPGLSEQFLYANDDMFINKPVTPDTFFADDGLPIIRLIPRPLRRLRWFWKKHVRKKLMSYSQAITNASELVRKRYGIYYNELPHHNIDAYLKSDCQKIVEVIFKDDFELTFQNHLRGFNDIQRVIYLYAALAEKRGHLRHVSGKESLFVAIDKKKNYEKIKRYNPLFFCLNDSQSVVDNDRTEMRKLLDSYFPDKSGFEK